MNSELKARIEYADNKLAASKSLLEEASAILNKQIGDFGKFRESTLIDTVGRFKSNMETLGKSIKDNKFEIPSSLDVPLFGEIHLEEITFTPNQVNQLSVNAANLLLTSSNKVLDIVAKRKGLNFNSSTTSNGRSGIWWLDMLQATLTIAATVAEKREREETAVVKYEKQAVLICRKIDAQLEFFSQIENRLEEIISVSEQLKERCTGALEKLEDIIDVFDVNNDSHLKIFQLVVIFVKGISEISKVKILDSEDTLSMGDQRYIIHSKQLLTSSL